MLVTEAWGASGACVADGDCELVTPRLRCTDNSIRIEECPIALSFTKRELLAQQTEEMAKRVCPLNCGYGSTPTCASLAAKCEGGACKIVKADGGNSRTVAAHVGGA